MLFSDQASIGKLLKAVRRLPSDAPVHNPKKWYLTQKEHWIGWLQEYRGPGAYGRLTNKKRDAGFAYNHIVNPKMLLWLIDAAGVDPELVALARKDALEGKTMIQQSAAIRRHVPWDTVASRLWPEK